MSPDTPSPYPASPEWMGVIWHSPPDDADDLIDCGVAVINASTSTSNLPPSAVVLDCRDFADHEIMLVTRRQYDLPALYLCPKDRLESLLDAIPPEDDAELVDAPARLLALRLIQLTERWQLHRDGLTRLPTRRVFQTRLDQMRQGASAGHPLSLLILDLDRFKAINDYHGHGLGDQLLRAVADRLQAACPEGTFLARIGGEEFGLLAPVGSTEARELAERLRQAVSSTPLVEDIGVTLSVGLATAAAPNDDLARRADQAMYAAKARGRDRAIHHEDLRKETAARNSDLDLETFENMTRVVADRVASLIAHRGRKLFEELRHEADYDSVTGLHSRRYLDRKLPQAFLRAQARDAEMTVALIDIDHFGRINKAHGWPSGDKILKDLADRVRTTLRGEDWVARYGGEELFVMFETDLEAAELALDRVRAAIAETPFTTTTGRAVHITVSVGLAKRDPADLDSADVLERASRRLNIAKQSGRNTIVADDRPAASRSTA